MDVSQDEDKAWLMKSENPNGTKAYEAIKPKNRSTFRLTRGKLILGTLVILGIWFLIRIGQSMGDPGSTFVSVNGMHFEADCRPHYLAGVNTHDLVQAALMTTYDYNMKKSGKARIREMMKQASGAGLNLIRTWAHTNHKKFPFQEKPGDYDETTFKALDYILDEARKHGIRVLLSFVDNWKYYNGVDQYVDWSKTAPSRGDNKRPEDADGDPTPLAFENEEIKKYEIERHALFWIDEGAKQIYKDHVRAILNRKNYLNGRLYKDDPTIFAWDLLNEPRCESYVVKECPQRLQKWIEEMSEYVKSEDPYHLVTIGSEGFFAENSAYVDSNPHDWAKDSGQDWMANHRAPNIDFATIHVWPDNWNRTDPAFQDEWISSHIKAANELKKPLLLEEFGKKLTGDDEDKPSAIAQYRDAVYKRTYESVEKAMNLGQNIQGSLFWRWNMPLFSYKGRGDYGVRPQDTTFKHIASHTNFINLLLNSQAPRKGCLAECWTPVQSSWSRSCKKTPEVCDDYWNDPSKKDRVIRVFPSQLACCRPGQGAFANGCSWSLF